MPTLEEIGIKGQEAETMTGVFVPAGTPKAIVDLSAEEHLRDREHARHHGAPAGAWRRAEGDSPASFAAYVKEDIAKWKKGHRGRQDSENLSFLNRHDMP